VTIVPPGSDRFGVGAQVWPYPPDLPRGFDACSDGTYREKGRGEGWDLPTFLAYTLYLPIECSSITAAAPGFSERARAAFAARESFGVAHELATGRFNTMNPHLTDSNLTILNSGTAVTPDVALSYLEDAIGETGQMGLIHLSPAAASAINGSGGYGIDLQSGVLRTTANGTPVAVDGGYIGVYPEAVGHAPSAGQAWAFATGPIQVRREGDILMLPESLREAMAGQTTENLVTYRAERDYLVTWDQHLQVAVLVDWTP